MKNLFILLLINVLSFHFCKGQNALDIRITKFKGNKRCAISYTFDDGLKEHATLVAPRFNKLGIKATFVVNGSKINENPDDIKDTTRMTWLDLREMAKKGHEISNHGWAHKNFGKFTLAQIQEDISKNDSAIFAQIGIMPRTFAYPNNTTTKQGIELASKNRVGTRLFQRSIGSKSTAKNLEDWVSTLLEDQNWGVGMTHGITYGYDHFANPEILWDHLNKLKTQQDKIWIGTFKDVVNYVTLRDSTFLEVAQQDNGRFVITPVCPLDPSIFNGTLTAMIKATDIKKAIIRQGKKKIQTKTEPGQIQFDFKPFGGKIFIELLKK